MTDLPAILHAFESTYGKTEIPPELYFAPGRVNLIGEHTDYNDGFVLPCAISFGTYLAARPSRTNHHSFRSGNMPFEARVPLAMAYDSVGGEWINYPLGIIQVFQEKGLTIPATDFYFYGDIPNSAGLSSSASIEMVTAFALNDLYGLNQARLDLVNLSKKAENVFVGVNCGIMDQFAVGMGRKDHALFLNCGTLNHSLVPLLLEPYRLVIMNTNKPRGLADSKYNERVAECQSAVDQLKGSIDISSLGQLSLEEFEKYSTGISDPVVMRRARHVVSENRRVLEAVKALWNENLEVFGKLMKESHDSLRDDYEVTGSELDALVGAATVQNGVIGARMTGAGFGGCAIALVLADHIEDFIESTGAAYLERTGNKADFYLPEIGDGVMSLGKGDA